jgi:D-threo-aldose 1-dehydrogenase
VRSTKVGRVLQPVTPPPKGTERWGFIDGLPYEPVFDYSYDGVMRSFDSSLQRLQVSKVDILLAHDLGQMTHGDEHARHWKDFMDGGYRAMRELQQQGVVRAIGLGVNEWQICADVLRHADVDVFLLAGRYTLLEQEPLDAFLPECVRRNVSIILGGPFNSGILINGASGGSAYYNYAPAPSAIIERVQAVQAICDAHSVPMAAAALAFPLAHPAVVSVIPGQASVEQVEAVYRWFQTSIPSSLWSDLRSAELLHPQAPVPS